MANVGQAPGQVEDEAANIIAETESFLRFGLSKRAQDHLQGALSRKPELKPVRERLVKLYESLREYKSAIAELRVLLGQCSDVQEEVRYLREILRLDDRDQAAQRRLTVITGTHRIDLSMVDEPDEPEISLGEGEDDAARRGWTAADRDTSEVPLADYREINESKRSQPERTDGWAENDAASTSEVPVADFKQYVESKRVKMDEAAWTQDTPFIRAMIRFEIDSAVFGMGVARRRLLEVDPQAQHALGLFPKAEQLLTLAKTRTTRAPR